MNKINEWLWRVIRNGQLMCVLSLMLGWIGWHAGILPLYGSLSVRYLKPIWTFDQVLHLAYVIMAIYYVMVIAISVSYLKDRS